MMKPHEYQLRLVEMMKSGRNLCLSVGMGLGKTISTLLYLDYLQPDSVYIVAPKRVSETVWMQEAEKWDLIMSEKMVIVKGPKFQRLHALADKRFPYKIISRENLSDISDFLVDVLIIDELTSFKSPDSQRSKLIQKIEAKQVIGLTGTLAPNGVIDIFPQMCALRLAVPSDFYGWRGTFFENVSPVPKFKKWKMRTGITVDDAIEKWRDRIITMRSEDYLDIPEVSHVRHMVDISNKERDNYVRLNATCMIEVDKVIYDVKEQAKFAKLQTAAGGFIYNDDHQAIQIGTSKYDEVVDFVVRCKEEGEPVLLFYAYQHEYLYIKMQLVKAGLVVASAKEGSSIERWNDGKLDVLMAHPASAGHGLNLQYGGRILVWSSITWNYELYAQANARLARQGQRKAVQIHEFLVKDTVESRIRTAIDTKEKLNDSLSDVNRC